MSTADRLVPSLIDRLVGPDLPPENSYRADPSGPVRDAVVRDLVHLLNTRSRCIAWPEELTELDTAVLNYGLPDFAGCDFETDGDREYLRDSIARVIETFEPRLREVHIDVEAGENPLDRNVRLQITARLIGPQEEPLVVDLRLLDPNGEFRTEAS